MLIKFYGGIDMNKELKKILNKNSTALENSARDFCALYSIMFNQDAILAEDNDGFRIRTYSYAQTRERIEEASCALYEKIGATHGFVALDMENSVDWIVAFWAILRSGNKPYLVNCRHPKSLADSALKRLDIKYAIGDVAGRLDAEYIDIDSLRTSNRFDGEFENELALSTSATSLKEVICFYTGKELCAQILNVKTFIGKYPEIANQYKGRIKNLAFLPFYHVFGLIAVYFWFTFFGQTVVFLKNYSADTILKTCKKHNVTHVFAVPMLWHTIEKAVLKKVNEKGEKKAGKFNTGLKLCTGLQNLMPHLGMTLSQKIMHEVTDELFGQSIRFCINGGSYIRQSALEMLNGIGYNLHNGYGMSEIGITSVELRPRPRHKNLNSVGLPFSSVEYKIEDGILYVRGNSICNSVWIDGEPIEMGDWFSTDDNAVFRNNCYYINGRAGDMIIGESGKNINPDVIEQSFTIPEAENFCVLGLERDGKKTVSMVVETGKYFSASKRNALIDRVYKINDSLPTTSRVQNFYFTKDPIKSESAVKVSRKYLLREIENGNVTLSDFVKTDVSEISHTALNEEILAAVTEIVAKTLDVTADKINPDAHIMLDMEADSLQYFSILSALADEFSLQATEKENLRYTVREMCEYIERHL